MKRFLITSILAAMVAVGTALMAQDYPDEYLGLPGDNFNLYAVMNLFQKSETLEGFEKSLNDENTRINNLDLNNDNLIDYVKVINYVDGNVHTIVLQAQLDRNDNQDVAVFTVQKLRDGEVQIQLIGDEALYGRNYIVEPIYAETPNPGYTGRSNRQNVTVVRTTYVEVAAWPLVRYIYLPDYRVWRSSWYWGYYPSYWNPWRPYYWHYYYGYHYNWYPTYYSYYHRYDRPRYDRWNDFYYRDKRVYSRNVTININDGRYKTTYSRPESRRDGEALYAKAHPDRASSMSTGTNGRRSASQAAPSRQSAGTTNAATRRSTGTVNQNVGTRSDQTQGTSGNARRSSTTVNRSTTTVNNRANTNSTAGQSTVTNRRSSETVSSRTSSGSQSTKAAEPARTTKQQSSGSSSTTRRSTERAPKETTVRQSTTKSSSTGSSKESESKSSRRK
jgi:hypothetical protein